MSSVYTNFTNFSHDNAQKNDENTYERKITLLKNKLIQLQNKNYILTGLSLISLIINIYFLYIR